MGKSTRLGFDFAGEVFEIGKQVGSPTIIIESTTQDKFYENFVEMVRLVKNTAATISV